jgi:hypothetical protein
LAGLAAWIACQHREERGRHGDVAHAQRPQRVIAYAQSLANMKGKDGEIFRNCLKWQVLAVAVSTIAAFLLIYLSV